MQEGRREAGEDRKVDNTGVVLVMCIAKRSGSNVK